MLAGVSVAALAQTNTPGARKVSLDDCIQSALEKNLDMRIARYNPPHVAQRPAGRLRRV